MNNLYKPSGWAKFMTLCAVVVALSGCAAALVAGAVGGGASAASDSRSMGTLIEDEQIEWRVRTALTEVGERGHINYTSFNRIVLLTGEVASAADRALAEQQATRVLNVRRVVNELGVMPNTTLVQRSTDSLITAKVKTALLGAKNLSAESFKVVTERGVVYLLGIVSLREANEAAELAATTSGVSKVVRVVEYTDARSAPASNTPGAAPVSAPVAAPVSGPAR